MPNWPDYLPLVLPPRLDKEYVSMSLLSRIMTH